MNYRLRDVWLYSIESMPYTVHIHTVHVNVHLFCSLGLMRDKKNYSVLSILSMGEQNKPLDLQAVALQQGNETFHTEWMPCSGEHAKEQEHIKILPGSTTAG